MKQYIGTKHIKAVAMNRLDYNVLRGWDLPADENGEDKTGERDCFHRRTPL